MVRPVSQPVDFSVQARRSLFILQLLLACILIGVSSILVQQWFYCGLMASKWVGLHWTPEMIATDRRGKLAGCLALAMQLLVPWVLAASTPSLREKPRNPILFAYITRSEMIPTFWQRYLIRLAISISATIALSALLLAFDA